MNIYAPHLIGRLNVNDILNGTSWKSRRTNNEREGNFDLKEETRKTIQGNLEKSLYLDAYLFEGGLERADWIIMFHQNGDYDVISTEGKLKTFSGNDRIQSNLGISFTSDGFACGFDPKFAIINPRNSFPNKEEAFLKAGFSNILTKGNIEQNFTSLASLRVNKGSCSATLRENSFVLETATHCVERLDGEKGLQETSDSLSLNSNSSKISFDGFTLSNGSFSLQQEKKISELGKDLQIKSIGTDSVLISSNLNSIDDIRQEKKRDSQLLSEAAKTNEALPALLYSAHPSFNVSPIIVFPGIKESDLQPGGSKDLTVAIAVPVEFYEQIGASANIPKLVRPTGNDETFLNGQSGGKVQVSLGKLEKSEGVMSKASQFHNPRSLNYRPEVYKKLENIMKRLGFGGLPVTNKGEDGKEFHRIGFVDFGR